MTDIKATIQAAITNQGSDPSHLAQLAADAIAQLPAEPQGFDEWWDDYTEISRPDRQTCDIAQAAFNAGHTAAKQEGT